MNRWIYQTKISSMICLFLLIAGSNIITAETHIIRFGGDLGDNYVPANLTVTVGDTIEWQGAFNFHPLASTSVPDGAEEFQNSTGTVFSYVVTVAGDYEYICTVHDVIGMTGSFTAEETPEPQPERTFIAWMLGEKEAPENDSEGQGGGMFILNGTQDSLWYYIRVCDLTGPIAAAHFHVAPAGVPGPVVRPINFTDEYAEGVWTSSDENPLTPALVDSLLAGKIYVNVHTDMYPAGEIRGQITDDEEVELFADLTGDQEVPPVNTPANGDGHFVLSGDGKSLDYHVTYENLSSAFRGAHFHRAPRDSAGPIVRPIEFQGNTADGTWRNTDPDPLTPRLVAELLGCNIYVNVHSENYPAGEIRGQILKELPDEPEPMPERTFIAWMLGEKEAPENDSEGQGGGMFILNGTQDSLWYYIRVCDLTGPIAAAHFHVAPAGVPGPVVRPINFTDEYAEGVWTRSDENPLTPALVDSLLAGKIYVNVHTDMYPAGEIRGQITDDEEVELFADLTGDQEVPPVNTPANGDGHFVLSGDGKSLDYHVTYENLSSAFRGAHFHRAPRDSAGPIVRPIEFQGNTADGTWRNTDPDPLTPRLVAELLGCNIYVNVHSENYPAGEIRGQILKEAEDVDEFPYMTFWAVNDANDGRLFYYTLSEGHDFSNVEGNITGINRKDIEDLAIDSDGTIYLINNVGTSKLYMINPDQLDKDPNTPVEAELVGDTELPAGAQPGEIASLHFINGTLYGIGKETKKLYSISTSDGSVTEVSELDADEFRTDDLVMGADSTVYLLKTVLSGPSEIWRFDDFPDGDISMVTVVEGSGKLEALAAHPNGNLYAADLDNLYEINLAENTIGILDDHTVDIEGMEFNYKSENGKAAVPVRQFRVIGKLTDVNEPNVKPTTYKLDQNFPNPFNPATLIRYSIPEDVHVKVFVYNSLGEVVTTLVNETKQSGNYEITFNAAGLPSGVYIYRIEAGTYIRANKMILMK